MIRKIWSASPSVATKVFASAAGRALVWYFLFEVLISLRADAAPTTGEIAVEESPEGLCTHQGIQLFLSQTSCTKDDLALAYEHCRAEFLDENAINSVVKQTIDDWVGTDLSKAETNQIFLAYELALVGPKPEHPAPEFVSECRQMVASFQRYRDIIAPLAQQVDIDLSQLLADGSDEVDEEERELLNYVQYAQFCRSLLTPDEGSAKLALNEM